MYLVEHGEMKRWSCIVREEHARSGWANTMRAAVGQREYCRAAGHMAYTFDYALVTTNDL
jgi:hypothetical protein